MPPPEVSRRIDPLRSKYDPKAFSSCPTHISISDPLRKEMNPGMDEEIAAILRGIPFFKLYFDGPTTSIDYAGVTDPNIPQGPVENIKQKLHQAAIFASQVYYRGAIPTRVTIAESWKILREIQANASSGSFVCDRLEFTMPDAP